MQAKLKLFASLSDFLPSGAQANQIDIDIGDGESVAAIIERFHLPDRLVHLVLVDGVFIKPEDRAQRDLKDGEVLAIWPPVAGG
ncbi:MoaD/ThiS family protein [Aliiruegeria sabulilitoris]|uniref:MoaD/ThiS family protein n=1 Tax=Aliiruegeria sabulilitoris TaxID=1510458 RepID=UPI000833C4ED|nr:MoaD/ThiS family protein [Aliiruegeria sabulilitoris]NDR58464.1 MoaD/ThiS family protein [Pseudoruegeria sp. M32A2M]